MFKYFLLILLGTFILIQCFLIPLVQSQYFTEHQKNLILNRFKQLLSNEAAQLIDKQTSSSGEDGRYRGTNHEMFNQMINYKGLYENLNIKNVTMKQIDDAGCHSKMLPPLLGIDYKRHRNRHHLVCFSQGQFLVRTFSLNNQNRQIVFDEPDNQIQINPIQGTILQMKFYRQYDTDQLFLAALVWNGLQQIRIFEVLDEPIRIMDKELLHTFEWQQQVAQIDVLHCEMNKYRIVALIDSGSRPMNYFEWQDTGMVIQITAPKALHVRTLRIQMQGLVVVANQTHWKVFRYHHDRNQQDNVLEMINIFQMKYFICDIQTFNNGHRYYVAIATQQEQYIYQWKDSRKGFQGIARTRQPMVYKMNSITISYSREDNFFYYDSINQDKLSIYGYDITNSVFILLKTISKSQHLNLPKEIRFHPYYSVNFYDHNFVYELKLSFGGSGSTGTRIYLFIYETTISNLVSKDDQDSTSNNNHNQITLYNLQRYNKQIYEKKIQQMTRNVYKLDRQETISKMATNLTFNFNVTFRAKVHVNRYEPFEAKLPRTININRRDYALRELKVSYGKIQSQIDEISARMEHLNEKLQTQVVYRYEENIQILGRKSFLNQIFVKKFYANQAWIHSYRHGGNRRVDDILANLYLVGSSVPISGRKTFLSPYTNVAHYLLVNQMNGQMPDDFLYTDLEQDVYSNVWYRNNKLQVDHLTVNPNTPLNANVTIGATVFINQNDQSRREERANESEKKFNVPIMLRNKLVFDKIEVDNLFVSHINDVNIGQLPTKVLLRNVPYQQQIKVPTRIDHLKIRGNVFVNEVNGHNVSHVLNNVIRRTRSTKFEQPVHFMADVQMNLLKVNGHMNNLHVPEDLVDYHSTQEIYGTKRFSSIHVRNLNVTMLNHLRIPVDIVTLTGNDEIIARDVSLDRLQVRGNLFVHGLFDGINLTHLDQRYLDTFQNNFANISFLAPVNVSKLTIQNGNINHMNLDQMYHEAYFKTERRLDIPSLKRIQNVFRCENILTKSINNDYLEDFVRIDQELSFSVPVRFMNRTYFKDVQLSNKIDNVPVYKLLQEVVTLDSFQKITGNRKFLDGIRVRNQLEILGNGSLNSVPPPENWLRYSKQQQINSPMKFTAPIKTRMFDHKGNIRTGMVNGENFTEKVSNIIYLDQQYGTNQDLQNIIIHCLNCTVENEVKTRFVNGKKFSEFLKNYVSRTRPQVINGEKWFKVKQQFRDIFTTENATVAGVDLRRLKHEAITVDGYNIITKPVVIHGNLSLIRGQIQTKQWNNINIEQFTRDVVRRSFHKNVRIEGDVIYQTDVDVMTNVTVKKLNKFYPEEVLMTTTGNYTIDAGNVRFNKKIISSTKNINVSGFVNQANLTELSRSILMTNEHGELILSNNNDDDENQVLNFLDEFEAKEFEVKGLVDDINVGSDSILMTNGEQNVRRLTLDGYGWFNSSMNIMSMINNMDKDNLKKIVLINSSEKQEIDFLKTFSKIRAEKIVHEKGMINFNVINHVDLIDFNKNAIYSNAERTIQMPKRFAQNITIQNPNLKIQGLINGIRLDDVVRLDRVKQTITGHKVFDSIIFNDDVNVRGKLNQIDLPNISTENMFLVYGQQRIKTPIRFLAPVFMMANNSVEWMNHFRPEDLLTIKDDNLIKGSLQFKNVIIQGPIQMENGFVINDVNITDVQQNALMLNNDLGEQILNGQLVVNEAIFIQNATLSSPLNDLDLSDQVELITRKFDPSIDSSRLQEELFKTKTWLAKHRHHLEFLSLEIDYFYLTKNLPLETLGSDLDNQHFWQRFIKQQQLVLQNQASNSFIMNNVFEILSQRKDILWQTVKVSPDRLLVSEIWTKLENSNQDLFRLISIEPITGRSWIIFEKNLNTGIRPFLFIINNRLHVIYFKHSIMNGYDDSCDNSETMLYGIDVDFHQMNHTEKWIQNFEDSFEDEWLIKNVGYYHQASNIHYLIFNKHKSNLDDEQSGSIVIYQRISINDNTGCDLFRLFQTLPTSSPVRHISLFDLGVPNALSETYLALQTDHQVILWKQEGVYGFNRKWILYTKPTPTISRSYGNNNTFPFLYPFVLEGRRFLIYIAKPLESCLQQTHQLYQEQRLIVEEVFEAKFNQDFQNFILFHHHPHHTIGNNLPTKYRQVQNVGLRLIIHDYI